MSRSSKGLDWVDNPDRKQFAGHQLMAQGKNNHKYLINELFDDVQGSVFLVAVSHKGIGQGHCGRDWYTLGPAKHWARKHNESFQLVGHYDDEEASQEE